MNDLTNKETAIEHLKQSTSEADWNRRVDDIKHAHSNAYPSWWYSTVVLSGLLSECASTWGGSDEITISPLVPLSAE